MAKAFLCQTNHTSDFITVSSFLWSDVRCKCLAFGDAGNHRLILNFLLRFIIFLPHFTVHGEWGRLQTFPDQLVGSRTLGEKKKEDTFLTVKGVTAWAHLPQSGSKIQRHYQRDLCFPAHFARSKCLLGHPESE